MFSARTTLSTFANAAGCGRHFALVLLLFCQLTYYAAIVNATLDLPTAELLQHAQQNADNYVKNVAGGGGENSPHHSMPYKQLMSHAFDANYELPPSVEDDQQYDDSAEVTDTVPDMSPKAKQAIMAAFPPAAASALFMQLHNEQKPQQKQQQHQAHMYKASAAKVQQQQHQRRHCNIEISTKIPGFCQPMQPIGSACVSGEYMDVFNLECM